MQITEIHIHPITPQRGLLAFAHIVLDGCILLGSIGIHEKREGGLRLTFPQKGTGYVFHPVTRQFGKVLEDAVINEAKTVLEKHCVGHNSTNTEPHAV